MNTYQYNISGVIRYVRAEDRFKAFLQVFHGELKRVGKCSLNPYDLKLVKNPRSSFDSAQDDGGNQITNQLRHI